MKRIYLSLYNFIWFCVSKHCARLLSHPTDFKHLPTGQFWLEEIGFIVQDKLDSVKEKKCLISLFRAYSFSLQILISTRNEAKLSAAKQSYEHKVQKIVFGQYSLVLLLTANTLLGLGLTYSFQVEQFSFASTLLAVLSYIGVAWCVFEARAIPLFKTTLILLIILTTFNTYFLDLWQPAEACYSEICALLADGGIFQTTPLKLSITLFWIICLVLLSTKNPIRDYLNYKKSTGRRL